MLKRSLAAIHEWLSPRRMDQVSLPQIQENEARAARRGFFKRSAVGVVSLTATAGLAKVVVDAVPRPDLQERYLKDGRDGEQELMDREYVLMSDREKEDMVQAFVDNYHDRG